jgi:hypothetical protein
MSRPKLGIILNAAPANRANVGKTRAKSLLVLMYIDTKAINDETKTSSNNGEVIPE